MLRIHYSKPPTKSLARQKLSYARQSESESIDELILRLRELAIDCHYDAAVLRERLREQFINGIRADRLKRKLLEAEDEDLDALLKRARTFEQVDRDVRSSRNSSNATNSSVSEAHLVEQHRAAGPVFSRPLTGSCNRCGGITHGSQSCWYKNQTCNYCGKLGHKAKVCFKAVRDRQSRPGGRYRSQPGDSGNGSNGNRGKPNQRRKEYGQHQLEAESACDNPEESVDTVNEIEGVAVPPLHATITVNGSDLKMELDTGSGHSVVNEQVWRELGFPILTPAPKLSAYGGFQFNVLGHYY